MSRKCSMHEETITQLLNSCLISKALNGVYACSMLEVYSLDVRYWLPIEKQWFAPLLGNCCRWERLMMKLCKYDYFYALKSSSCRFCLHIDFSFRSLTARLLLREKVKSNCFQHLARLLSEYTTRNCNFHDDGV